MVKIKPLEKKKRKRKNKGKFKFSLSLFIAFLYSFLCGNGYIFLLYSITIVLHALIHCIVAVSLGYTLEKFELSITGASMNLENDSFYANDELIIALAGPMFNLFVFILFSGLWWIFPSLYNFTFDFAIINLFVFALNILPLYSFDGGRIVVFLFSRKFERKQVVLVIRYLAIFFSFILFLLFLISIFVSFNFSLGVVSVFLFVSAVSHSNYDYTRVNVVSKKEKLARGLFLEEKTYIFSDNARLIDLFRKLKSNEYSLFCVMKKDGKMVCFDEDKLTMLIEKYSVSAKLNVINI